MTKGVLIICTGLPGSGKSTYAEKKQKSSVDRRVYIVNKDDIRKAFTRSGWVWSQENEKDVILERDTLITNYLRSGYVVISSDTNFGRHIPNLKRLAEEVGAQVLVEDFTSVPVETCIARDALRPENERVGINVIWGMYDTYLANKVIAYVPDHTKPLALICDLDGTVALHNGRGPFDYEKCGTDLLNEPIAQIVKLHALNGFTIVYMSGRDDSAREKSLAWLKRWDMPDGPLFMRPGKDFRKDYIVKLELFNKYVRDHYDVRFALDDRDQVVKLWRSIGLTCLQVAEGIF